jgi:hypothetical protein
MQEQAENKEGSGRLKVQDYYSTRCIAGSSDFDTTPVGITASSSNSHVAIAAAARLDQEEDYQEYRRETGRPDVQRR